MRNPMYSSRSLVGLQLRLALASVGLIAPRTIVLPAAPAEPFLLRRATAQGFDMGGQYACLGGVLRKLHAFSNEAQNNAALLLVVYALCDPSHLSGIARKFCGFRLAMHTGS